MQDFGFPGFDTNNLFEIRNPILTHAVNAMGCKYKVNVFFLGRCKSLKDAGLDTPVCGIFPQ